MQLFCQWTLLISLVLGTLGNLISRLDKSGPEMLGAIIGAAIGIALLYGAGAYSLILP